MVDIRICDSLEDERGKQREIGGGLRLQQCQLSRSLDLSCKELKAAAGMHQFLAVEQLLREYA